MNTKKELGQHWLKDATSLRAIVEAAQVTPGDKVLEIGPGLGTLTDVLIERGATVIALEFDRDLIKSLLQKYLNCDNIAIIEGDVRTFDFGTLDMPYKVVANIPYYLTSHLIRSLSETSNPPVNATLLVQKELAQRLCAVPGNMSILAVTAQFYFECSLGIEVPATLFTPQPKVDSQVAVLSRRQEPLFKVDAKEYFRLVKAGFSEKRKTLRNTLSGGLQISKEDSETLLDSAGIASSQRAQELSLEQWHAIYKVYTTNNSL